MLFYLFIYFIFSICLFFYLFYLFIYSTFSVCSFLVVTLVNFASCSTLFAFDLNRLIILGL